MMRGPSRNQGASAAPAAGGHGVRRSRYYLGDAFVVEHGPGPREGPVSETGVILMPPLGYEDTCAYRPLRVLADALAGEGHVVMRLDWPSLGDSAYDAFQVDLVTSGRAVVAAAAQSLRDRGITRVAGIGVRGGGLIALGASGLDELALVGVPASGKAFLREERAFHQTAARAFGEEPDSAKPLPDGAVEAGGFVYGPSTVESLRQVSPKALVAAGNLHRVLVICREGLAAPTDLLESFERGGAEVSISAAQGLGDMLENSYHSELSSEIREAVRSWLGVHQGRVELTAHRMPIRLDLEGGITERTVVLHGDVGDLSGILCEPRGGATPGLAWTLFLNAGGIRRSGPNRLWTRAARSLAAKGTPSLRFDVRDVGDSDGTNVPHPDLEAMYSESAIQDVVQAYDWARARGAGEIDVVGLCSGSFLGMQLAARRQIRRAVLFNGLAFVWNDDARASGVTSHIGASLFDPRRWRRLLTGRISLVGVIRAIFSKTLLKAAAILARLRGRPQEDEVEALVRVVVGRGTRLHLVSSEGDPSLPYLERHVAPEYRPPSTTLPGVDHTIRPIWAHDRVVDLILGK
jgi:alpha/beta superfamily hydrolase